MTVSHGPVILVAACLVLAGAADAHAYLDPGTGSYVLQVAIAAVLGALFAVKSFWSGIKGYLARVFKRGKRTPDGP